MSGERTTAIVSFHPQRGGILTLDPVPRPTWKYRGGKDSDWYVVKCVVVMSHNGNLKPVAGQTLPKGFLFGDPSVQVSGMGMFHQIYGPLDRRCVECGTHFVWPAAAQKKLYEVVRAHVNTVKNRCHDCAKAKDGLERARVAYAAAIEAAKDATTAKPHLELARMTLALLDAGGRANLERAISSCRKARRLGGSADELEAKLAARRVR